MISQSEEYKTLREEIIEHQRLRMQILVLSTTASSLIIGAILGFRSKAPPSSFWYLVIPALYLLLTTGCIISRILSDRIKYIGAYISIFIEEEENKWETVSYTPVHPLVPRSMVMGITIGYSALGVIDLIVLLYVLQLNPPKFFDIHYLYSLGGGLSLTLILWHRAAERAKERYIKYWKEIKEGKKPPQQKFSFKFVIKKYISLFFIGTCVSFFFLHLR